MRVRGIGFAGLGFCLLALPALAHHTDIMLDFDKTVEKSGTVKEFHIASPHSALYVMVADESGKSTEWQLDLESPGVLARAGWTPTTIVPGDKVTVTLHPLKDGSPGGQALTVKLPDGTVMGD
nr:MAG: hypothetical protein E4H34_02390 [Hyphomicrobiales bacterium]